MCWLLPGGEAPTCDEVMQLLPKSGRGGPKAGPCLKQGALPAAGGLEKVHARGKEPCPWQMGCHIGQGLSLSDTLYSLAMAALFIKSAAPPQSVHLCIALHFWQGALRVVRHGCKQDWR